MARCLTPGRAGRARPGGGRVTALELWTWIAIGVLTIGSAAVFGWFVYDLMRLGIGGDGGE